MNNTGRSMRVGSVPSTRLWRLKVLALWSLAAFSQTVPTATIKGAVFDESGAPLAGVHVVATTIIDLKGATSFTKALTVTAADGYFTLSSIQPGYVRVCPWVPGSDLLNPCDWFDPVPAVVAQPGHTSGEMRITMPKGNRVSVRIDDNDGVLKPDSKGARQKFVSVEIVSGKHHKLLPFSAEDGSGQNYEFVVPPNRAVKISVSAPALVLQKGTPGSESTIDQDDQVFSLQATDPPLQLRYKVKSSGK